MNGSFDRNWGPVNKNKGAEWQKCIQVMQGVKTGLWKKYMDSFPLPSGIACSKDDDECNVGWVVYEILFTNEIAKRIFLDKYQKSWLMIISLNSNCIWYNLWNIEKGNLIVLKNTIHQIFSKKKKKTVAQDVICYSSMTVTGKNANSLYTVLG